MLATMLGAIAGLDLVPTIHMYSFIVLVFGLLFSGAFHICRSAYPYVLVIYRFIL